MGIRYRKDNGYLEGATFSICILHSSEWPKLCCFVGREDSEQWIATDILMMLIMEVISRSGRVKEYHNLWYCFLWVLTSVFGLFLNSPWVFYNNFTVNLIMGWNEILLLLPFFMHMVWSLSCEILQVVANTGVQACCAGQLGRQHE